jgi:threonine synthase
VAGLLQLHAAGELPRSGVAVCILTGNGLKDPDWAIAGAPAPQQVGPHVDEVAAAIGF